MDPFVSVYGHVTIDTIFGIDTFLPPGITADALSKKTALGGTGPNIAVAAARLGCPTALCAFIGPESVWCSPTCQIPRRCAAPSASPRPSAWGRCE